MKLIQFCVILLWIQLPIAAQFALPDDIAMSFRRPGHRVAHSAEIYVENKPFLEYTLKNWRDICANIECLPPKDGLEGKKAVMFNASVITLGYACANLPPMEYVEFFEHVVSLYEQKRISFTAFENIYYGADIKHGFWSVNWEHPRVQAIFERIREFDTPPDKVFLALVEDQARGELADNYMTNVSDDTPPPETLSGIRLQRPWASLIRKYEAMTGKRVPVDPNYPDHNIARPSRKGLREMEMIASVTPFGTETVKPWWRNSVVLMFSMSAVLLAAVVWMWRIRRTT